MISYPYHRLGGLVLIFCFAFTIDCGVFAKKGDLSFAEHADIHRPSSTTSQIGQSCTIGDIFACGNGGDCLIDRKVKGQGICQCVEDFEPSENGTCIKHKAVVPTDVPSHPDEGNSSYSATVGVVVSILILLAIAAAVFYGTKYHFLDQIRSRLPLSLRCWPFPRIRRTNVRDDNVSLAYPIDEDDDDVPLLL